MTISVIDPIRQTIIVMVPAIIILLLTFRAKPKSEIFSKLDTDNLKGFAIIAIVLSHIGYFLDDNDRFLYPFSVFAGVGVNLFLILSGYGLTMSMLQKRLSIGQFYRHRLFKIYLPLWIVLITLFLVFTIFQGSHLEFGQMLKNLLGFFPQADIYLNINSPLWYITPVIFYYLLFPILFYKKFPIISAGLLFIISFYLVKLNLPISEPVLKLYKLHILAFPAGIVLAYLITKIRNIKLKNKGIISNFNSSKLIHTRIFILILLSGLLGYLAIESEVGETIEAEQSYSLISVFIILMIGLIMPFRVLLLEKFGKLSFEIYLIHWPLIYNFNLFYRYFPASVATILSIIEIYVLAVYLNKLTAKINNIFRRYFKNFKFN